MDVIVCIYMYINMYNIMINIYIYTYIHARKYPIKKKNTLLFYIYI